MMFRKSSLAASMAVTAVTALTAMTAMIASGASAQAQSLPKVVLAGAVTRNDASGKPIAREWYQVNLTSTLFRGRVYYSYRATYQDTDWRMATSYRVIRAAVTGNKAQITAACQFATLNDTMVLEIVKDPIANKSSVHMTIRDYYGRILLDRMTSATAPLDDKAVVNVSP